MLTLTLRQMEVSIAYAIWADIGTLLVSLTGIFFFHEPASALKLASMLLVILGVVGRNLAGADH